MNWLTNFVRPKIRALVAKDDVPDNLWRQCPGCEQMIFHRELEAAQNVCPNCNHHMRLLAEKRLELLYDDGIFQVISTPYLKNDPLKFRDKKKYIDRLKEARNKTGVDDSLIVSHGKIRGQPAVVASMNFAFMGGSMGTALGKGLVFAAQKAIEEKAPLIAITSSGGARMQEGILSLMQMPRSIIAIKELRESGLPYITVLTDPTTGGVSASFAMLGDIAIAEPGAIVGFAGARVIQETIREQLPDGFQRAEYLLEHGMIDRVVHRHNMSEELGRIIELLMNKHSSEVVLIKKFGKSEVSSENEREAAE